MKAASLLIILCVAAIHARPAQAGRHLMSNDPICDIGTAVCAVACLGYSYHGTNCKTGNCVCSNNPFSAAAGSCFPGSARVVTDAGEHKRMADLRLGDRIQAVAPNGSVVYEAVYMFTSRRPEERAQFLRVATASGRNLTLTHGHYLPAARQAEPNSWIYTVSEDLRVGDHVMVMHGAELAPSRVTSVVVAHDVGLFNPHTRSGVFVVDGVVATELTDVVPRAMARPAFHKAMRASLNLLITATPKTRLDAGILSSAASWFHAGARDATINREFY